MKTNQKPTPSPEEIVLLIEATFLKIAELIECYESMVAALKTHREEDECTSTPATDAATAACTEATAASESSPIPEKTSTPISAAVAPNYKVIAHAESSPPSKPTEDH
jgi:hypothetical protein